MRNMSKWLIIGAMALAGGTVLIAEEAPAAQAVSASPATRPAKAGKLIKPWSEISDLTDDQKAQIIAIHDQANQDRDAVSKKEHADIMAVLTEDQKKTLAEDEAKARTEAAAKRHHGKPTTPATNPA